MKKEYIFYGGLILTLILVLFIAHMEIFLVLILGLIITSAIFSFWAYVAKTFGEEAVE
jgi:hypothetical protein